jgi:broad specificity phosphatase PhoE
MAEVREWDYGDYEGLLSAEIKEKRGEDWNIWVDGYVMHFGAEFAILTFAGIEDVLVVNLLRK